MLRPNDTVGVLAFDNGFEWVVPPTRIAGPADVQAVQARIAGIEPGGGTAILPALQAAHDAALQSDARLRHIVLLTDGQSSDDGFEPLLQQMRAERITLSTVAVGSDADRELLTLLAELGKGRDYFTERSSQIPRIASKETSILTRNAVVEGRVGVLAEDASPLVRGLTADLPALQGYVATTPREQAVTALQTARGDPLLAHWQYGLGRVVAWTSDAFTNGWAAGWSPDEADSGTFWSRLVRWSMPSALQPDFLVSSQLDANGRQVTLAAERLVDDGSFANGQDIHAIIVLPDGTARELRVPQTAPGRYERVLDVDQPGIYRVLFSHDDGSRGATEELSGFAVPAAGPEQRTLGLNQPLLARLAEQSGGREIRGIQDLLSGPAITVGDHREPLWHWPIALAILLLPLDVAVRRNW
jgi:hypothetical protein